MRYGGNRVEGIEDRHVHEIVLHPHPLEGLEIVDEWTGGAQLLRKDGATSDAVKGVRGARVLQGDRLIELPVCAVSWR